MSHTCNDFTPTPQQIAEAKISAYLRSAEGRHNIGMAMSRYIQDRKWVEREVRRRTPLLALLFPDPPSTEALPEDSK